MTNLPLLKDLYYKAVTRCEDGNAWNFEKHFTEVILEEIVPLIDYSYRDTLNNIENHFGVKLDV